MYQKKAHIHFVGIGGIGMSGIAHILREQGYTISGCDLDIHQASIKNLTDLNCTVYQGNFTAGCQDDSIDILVYSSALRPDNPEIQRAQQRGIPTIARAVMLAELMRTKYSIAIAGAHGKTTTTSLISHILIEAKKDPTIIIGGHLKNISTNARLGTGDFLVAEADESDRSFLKLYPTLAVVTNIDLEHLETYKDLDDIKASFTQFLNNLPFYGKAIICIDDANIRSLLPLPSIKIIKYGIEHEADFSARDIQLNADHSIFTVYKQNQKLGTIFLSMPGKHNVLNSLAAIALTDDLGVSFETSALALQNFKGIDRRFTFKGTFKGVDVFDDYGHHPVEIYNTLLVAKKRSRGKLTVVFQPHRYSRTHKLWDLFISTFLESPIDHLIITDIFPASENPIDGITSQRFVQELKAHNPPFTVEYQPLEADFHTIKASVASLVHENDLLLLLGAGKVNKLVETL